MSATSPRATGWNSSENTGASTSFSAAGTEPGKGNTSALSIGTDISFRNDSGPTSNALPIEDLLLIFQEDLRNLQRAGVRISAVNLPHGRGVALALYGVVLTPDGNLVLQESSA